MYLEKIDKYTRYWVGLTGFAVLYFYSHTEAILINGRVTSDLPAAGPSSMGRDGMSVYLTLAEVKL